jgi:hypothetical protein
LSIDDVKQRVERGDELAKQLQKSNWIWRRAMWADRDRKSFFKKLHDMRNYIIDLESMVGLRAPQDPSPLLDQVAQWSVSQEADTIQHALKRLHDALASINPSNATLLTMQINEEPRTLANQVSSQQGGPSLDPNAFTFVFHAHLEHDLDKPSRFLYAETLQSTSINGRLRAQGEHIEKGRSE